MGLVGCAMVALPTVVRRCPCLTNSHATLVYAGDGCAMLFNVLLSHYPPVRMVASAVC